MQLGKEGGFGSNCRGVVMSRFIGIRFRQRDAYSGGLITRVNLLISIAITLQVGHLRNPNKLQLSRYWFSMNSLWLVLSATMKL